jgi:hypothetical protein
MFELKLRGQREIGRRLVIFNLHLEGSLKVEGAKEKV